MFEQNNDNGLDAYQYRSGDDPLPERRRGRPHQQRHDPMLYHIIGVARAMVCRNIGNEEPTLLPASR